MEEMYFWWGAAAVLIAIELITGTFYFLAVGIGVACGGIAALFDFRFEAQVLFAALAGVIATLLLRQWKRRLISHTAAVTPDIGRAVKVEEWRDDGTARVAYRGSKWDAELESKETRRAETMYIRALRGSTLILGNDGSH